MKPCCLLPCSITSGFLQAFIVQLLRFPLLLLLIVIPLKCVLQLGRDLLEEADLLAEVMLHLRAEVPYPRTVEVLDLCQGGAGNDVAAVVELAFLLWTVFHFGQRTWGQMGGGGGVSDGSRSTNRKTT